MKRLFLSNPDPERHSSLFARVTKFASSRCARVPLVVFGCDILRCARILLTHSAASRIRALKTLLFVSRRHHSHVIGGTTSAAFGTESTEAQSTITIRKTPSRTKTELATEGICKIANGNRLSATRAPRLRGPVKDLSANAVFISYPTPDLARSGSWMFLPAGLEPSPADTLGRGYRYQ